MFRVLQGAKTVLPTKTMLSKIPDNRSTRWKSFGRLVLCCCLVGVAHALPADDSKSPSETSTFTFMFENDLFGDRDEQYTNGIQIGWLSPDLKHYAEARRLPRWFLPIVAAMPFINTPGNQHNVGFSLGQKIYTPRDIQSFSLIREDRPYAGWLYAGLAFVSKSAERLDTIEIQAGVVGPYAQGEETQNFVHSIRDLLTAKGWDNQLENEPGFALIYEHKRRPWRSTNPSGWGYDVIVHAGGAAGNVFTYLNAGAEVRVGWNLPGDYGTSVIRPGGDTNAPTTVDDPRLTSKHDFGVHIFSALTGRYMIRDIFLDGNTFSNSHDVDKQSLVGDLIVGASFTYRRIKLSYAQVFRTREFEGQADKHNFGSVSISITF